MSAVAGVSRSVLKAFVGVDAGVILTRPCIFFYGESLE
jgi:hypothetical protein